MRLMVCSTRHPILPATLTEQAIALFPQAFRLPVGLWLVCRLRSRGGNLQVIASCRRGNAGSFPSWPGDRVPPPSCLRPDVTPERAACLISNASICNLERYENRRVWWEKNCRPDTKPTPSSREGVGFVRLNPVENYFRASSNDSNSARPSAEPRIFSAARSGWGIMPMTLKRALAIPAMLAREPLGLPASSASPSGPT